MALERRRHTAGWVRLSAIEGISFERDLGPFVRGVIDAHETRLHTDGYSSYFGFPKIGLGTAAALTTGRREPSSERLVTEYGLGPTASDGLAAVALVAPGAVLELVSAGTTLREGLHFDVEGSVLRRIGGRSAVEVSREQYGVLDPARIGGTLPAWSSLPRGSCANR